MPLRPAHEVGLTRLFGALVSAGDDHWFHPHGFDAESARRLCNYSGRDLYFVAVLGGAVIAYGMLRGWDEGYEVPSLGIAVHPEFRGRGVAQRMMTALHVAASKRGASRVRLTVETANVRARRLYESLRYVGSGIVGSRLVLMHDLRAQ